MASETASLVSGSSVMLAAFGFYYNAVKGVIDAGAAASTSPGNPEVQAKARKVICAGRNTAWTLALVAFVIFLLLSSYVAHEIEAAIDVGFALSAYSTLDVIFVVLAFGWLGIAAFFGWQARNLTGRVRSLDEFVEREQARRASSA